MHYTCVCPDFCVNGCLFCNPFPDRKMALCPATLAGEPYEVWTAAVWAQLDGVR